MSETLTELTDWQHLETRHGHYSITVFPANHRRKQYVMIICVTFLWPAQTGLLLHMHWY